MASTPCIIGISGKMGTGKTSVAGALAERLCDARRLAFADMLKEEAARVFQFPLDACYHDKERVLPATELRAARGMPHAMTVRELLQRYGTDIVRHKSPEYWTRKMDAQLRELPETRFVIIDDVRFPNEAEFVKERGGLLVRLEPFAGHVPGAGRDHISETALDDFAGFDLTIRPSHGPAGPDRAAHAIVAALAAIRDQ